MRRTIDAGRRCTQLTLALATVALLACAKPQQERGHEPGSTTAAASSAPSASARAAAAGRSASACSQGAHTPFADPQQAYAAYAEAVNAADWCRAIQTFAPDARAEVAVMNFKTLALAAGADNPKRDAYQEQFARFCGQHQLRCGSPESAAALAQGLMLRMPLEAELGEVRALAAQQAEDVYVALMHGIAAADPAAMSQFDVPLREVSVEGDHATGKAPQTNGRVSPLPFIKSGSGWLLAAR